MKRIVFAAAMALIAAAVFSAEAATIDGVPFVEQRTRYCGPAALTSMFRFYGVDADQDMIAEAVYDERFRGSLITDMNHYAESFGFSTTLDTGTLTDLRRFIDSGIPVIAFIDQGFWLMSRPHYVVVFGYDNDTFIMHDGYDEAISMPADEFRKKWEKQGSPFLAVYP